MERTINVLAALVLIVLIGILGWVGYLLIDDNVDSNVKVGVLALLGAVGATLLTHWSAKKREVDARLFDKKRECYEALFGTIATMLAPEHAKKPLTQRQLTQAILKHRKELAMWGDADLINWWLRMGHMPDQRSLGESLKLGEDLLRNIRKELGWDDSSIKRGHLIALFLKESPEDVAKQMDGA